MSSLLELNRFFVNQKAKLMELTTEYKILDEQGNEVGAIRQEGQSAVGKLARLTVFGQLGEKRLAVYDATGTKVLEIVKPRSMKRSSFQVTDGQGLPVGEIAQQKRMQKKARFTLTGPQGEPFGEILSAKSWRAREFVILDGSGAEVGRITKKWAGAAKELLTSADNYLVEINPGVQGPLRLLAFAGAAGVDTVLHPM